MRVAIATLKETIGAIPVVLGGYVIALIVGGHGAAPMFMVVFWGLKGLCVAGHQAVWIVSAALGIPSVAYLLLLALQPGTTDSKARARRVPLIGLYLSWLLPTAKAAAEEGAGFIAMFPIEIIASLPFRSPSRVPCIDRLVLIPMRSEQQRAVHCSHCMLTV
ncbi:hypothetical protein A7D17_12605 [Xanthomonas floridensis]|uniref:Uncharacterized protein n=1 Tax=Xanthomonas floridensis TaxID=1843580 RepID=A0A1A9MF41_9XANT|nr:hypothetical protein A7D17_12605 [Xanthomonas floridensis]